MNFDVGLAEAGDDGRRVAAVVVLAMDHNFESSDLNSWEWD